MILLTEVIYGFSRRSVC